VSLGAVKCAKLNGKQGVSIIIAEARPDMAGGRVGAYEALKRCVSASCALSLRRASAACCCSGRQRARNELVVSTCMHACVCGYS
jgi:hypothetical protein